MLNEYIDLAQLINQNSDPSSIKPKDEVQSQFAGTEETPDSEPVRLIQRSKMKFEEEL